MANAENLEMSENVGMINLCHFTIFDVSGPDAEALMEFGCVAKVGGDTPVGKGVYTHFLDSAGGVRADLTVLRLAEQHYRVIDGADAGHRDLVWVRRMAEDHGYNASVTNCTTDYGCIGVWGPNARRTLQQIAADPAALESDQFPFAASRQIDLGGVRVNALRISCRRARLGIALQDGRWPGLVGRHLCTGGDACWR